MVLDSTVLNYIFVHIFLLAYAYAGYSANVSQHIAGGPERLWSASNFCITSTKMHQRRDNHCWNGGFGWVYVCKSLVQWRFNKVWYRKRFHFDRLCWSRSDVAVPCLARLPSLSQTFAYGGPRAVHKRSRCLGEKHVQLPHGQCIHVFMVFVCMAQTQRVLNMDPWQKRLFTV